MLTDDAQLWQLLRSLDDPDLLEHPVGYDHRGERARFEQLAQRLDAAFGCRCEVDRHVEDASFHGRIDIPATATATGHPLVVVVSNFGGLAVLAVDNPGVWTDDEVADLLHTGDRDRVSAALGELGYTHIPEGPLWRRYDGTWDPDVFSPGENTWWVRYFDYL
ncbi:hypothetical protein [Catellatospora paridis]|uniref:hypothetical protein n=1 Tax=Catellatospora paridis TaxID=1617086 RepID=UPI0012D47B41|nr:hypothetical protein [Catellatospora paridis]